MTSPYWPSAHEVDICIRTEAEELADGLVLAVHEPMSFRRVAARESAGEIVPEATLLSHVIQTNRPTPVIGESGFGKSHVIRWLHIQLIRKSRPDWHIVRISKNASLRQALTAILKDLRGSLFDDARQRINVVGTGLTTQDVAEHLVVFVRSRLARLYEETQQQVEQMVALRGTQLIDAEQDRHIKAVKRHAKPDGIASLLGDPNFKSQITGKGRCFYEIAKQLTEGFNDEEIEFAQREMRPEDLVVEANLSDLSLEARTYVRNAQLNTSEEKRKEAAELVNGCLSDASRAAFQQLFQFHSGSFQDLFVAIRKSLRKEGKTLFILVEDMATISAIEDVLIDSLMQEDVREGEQELCPLHSAIAVTTGYRGYARRQASLSTRAGFEWNIERSGTSEEATRDRIADFCGRYLNAARFGERRIVDAFRRGVAEVGWPGIWQSDESHYKHTAAIFGESPSGFPLFPFSVLALGALSKRYCQPGDVLEFNPRKILKHILREPLKELRGLYERGEFPPEGFAGVECPSSLQTELRRRVRDDVESAETLAAVWGYGSESIPELAHQLRSEVASEFGLASLAKLLESSNRQAPAFPLGHPVRQSDPVVRGGSSPQPPIVVMDDPRAVYREVDDYFSRKSIPQEVANKIRKALADAFREREENLGDWYVIKAWPAIKQGARTLIDVPFNSNNPPGAKLKFGTQPEFENRESALKYKSFIVAVLRRSNVPEKEQRLWSYEGGWEDYCNYSNFLDEWVPDAAQTLSAERRLEATKILEEQLSAATVFDPQLTKRSLEDRRDRMVMTADKIKSTINCRTGIQEWDLFLESQLTSWTEKQNNWLDAFSTNRHALEGDLVTKVIRRSPAVAIPPVAQRVSQKVSQSFVNNSSALELLQNCETRDEWKESLEGLRGIVARLSSAGQFQGMEKLVTARTYRDRITRVIESESWETTRCALVLRRPFEAAAVIKALHGFDLEPITKLTEILQTWCELYTLNRQRILNENEEQGAGRRKDYEKALGELIGRFGVLIAQCERSAS